MIELCGPYGPCGLSRLENFLVLFLLLPHFSNLSTLIQLWILLALLIFSFIDMAYNWKSLWALFALFHSISAEADAQFFPLPVAHGARTNQGIFWYFKKYINFYIEFLQDVQMLPLCPDLLVLEKQVFVGVLESGIQIVLGMDFVVLMGVSMFVREIESNLWLWHLWPLSSQSFQSGISRIMH